jgi:hypothetical protein
MTLSIDQFINIKIVDSSATIEALDQSLLLIATDQYSDAFIDGLWATFSSQTEVETNFGTSSDVAKASAKAFGSDARPQKIVIAYWNKSGTSIAARANTLQATQSPLQFSSLAKTYNFTITSRNVNEEVSFTADDTVTDYATLATALNTKLGSSSRFAFAYNSGVFSLASKVDGADVDTDNIQIVIGDYELTDIADDLRLNSTRLAKQIRGMDATDGTKETPTALISKLERKGVAYYGFYASPVLTDSEIVEFGNALTSTAKRHVFGYTALADYMLDYNSTNPLYQLALLNSRRIIVQLNKLNDRHAVVALLVQAGSTNWDGSNTAQNMKFKKQTVNQVDENIDTTMVTKANRLGINYYASFDGLPMLAEGRTLGTTEFFIDSTTFRDSLENTAKVDVANFLASATSKVPQDDDGMAQIMSILNATFERYAVAGAIGRNLKWNGPGFGLLSTGDILPLGYYTYAQSFTTQSQNNREKRKGMPIQCAVKESGAINSLDITINVER